MTSIYIDILVKDTLKAYKTVYVPNESSGRLRQCYPSVWDILGT